MLLIGLGAFAILSWSVLLFGWHGFWRSDQRLAKTIGKQDEAPSVAVVVPARDEAKSIGACVASILNQDYPGFVRVIVVDDASTDETADIARQTAERLGRPIEIVNTSALPVGWSGKLWAVHNGIMTAANGTTQPDWIWLTDADIVHGPTILARLFYQQQETKADLVSLMVKLRCQSFWEQLIIPAFIFFFQLIYPFKAINNPRSSIAGAAGGCILVRYEKLCEIGGIESLREAIIDDCTLGQRIKAAGGRLWLGLADDSLSLRGAQSLGPLWRMVKRSAFIQLRTSWILLVGAIIGLVMTFLVPPALFLSWGWHQNTMAAFLGLMAWLMMTYTYRPTIKDYGLPLWRTILLPVVTALYGAMTIDSALAYGRGVSAQWKGRSYPTR